MNEGTIKDEYMKLGAINLLFEQMTNLYINWRRIYKSNKVIRNGINKYIIQQI